MSELFDPDNKEILKSLHSFLRTTCKYDMWAVKPNYESDFFNPWPGNTHLSAMEYIAKDKNFAVIDIIGTIAVRIDGKTRRITCIKDIDDLAGPIMKYAAASNVDIPDRDDKLVINLLLNLYPE